MTISSQATGASEVEACPERSERTRAAQPMSDGRWAMGDGRWAMSDGLWAMSDGR
jgi:hypothetical protein